MSSVSKQLYSIPDAADCLGVKRSTIYNLVLHGELTRVHVGRRSLITGESLDQYIQKAIAVANKSRKTSAPPSARALEEARRFFSDTTDEIRAELSAQNFTPEAFASAMDAFVAKARP